MMREYDQPLTGCWHKNQHDEDGAWLCSSVKVDYRIVRCTSCGKPVSFLWTRANEGVFHSIDLPLCLGIHIMDYFNGRLRR